MNLSISAAPLATARAFAAPRWSEMLPFAAVHIAALASFWCQWTWSVVACGVVLFIVRMFGVTGGYHRYFSHRSFKTSRTFQFLLAVLAETSAQKGVLWWAAHHRHHHRHSDQEGDEHSPWRDGFWYAHLGWLWDDSDETELVAVRDFACYPELRWLNRFYLVPPLVLAVMTFWLFGWSGLVAGFFVSTVLLWHMTFCINSVAHVWGSRRYPTNDHSRNNFLLALVTLGEGWHNNHHYLPGSARQGFQWWEIDVTYYLLRALQALRCVWDLSEPRIPTPTTG